MVRISKSPEQRRHELVDTALRLFVEKGYEQTTVSDIVKKLGLAQGTFYYHFKSKAEVLDAVVENITAGLADRVRGIVDTDMDAATRVRQVVGSLFEAVAANHQLVAFFSKEGNERLHDRVRTAVAARLTPLLEGLMKEGLATGSFDVPFPREAAEVLLATMAHLTQASRSIAGDLGRLGRLHQMVELTILRTLGIKQAKPESPG